MRRFGKALLVHADLYGGGGAEVHAVRILRLLSERFDQVTAVHVGGPLDADRIERAWGVRLDPDRVRFETAGLPGRLLARGRRRYRLLEYAAALRHARRVAPGYDLVVSTFGECTVAGPRVLQAVCIPLFFSNPESLAYLGVPEGGRARQRIRRAYVRLCRRIAHWDPAEVARHATIANSGWTAGVVNARYGIDHTRCHYPGATTWITPGTEAYVPFAEREDGFVILGRLVPNKRLETAIEIVLRLRERGHPVHLHILGRADGEYGATLRRRILATDGVTLHEDLPRAEMERLIVRHRYGLHAYRYEHFGSAPAELQRLGCLVFCHDSGGQREVIRSAPQRYTDVADAVARIERVMADASLQRALLDVAARVNDELTLEAFEDQFLRTVDVVMARPPGPLPRTGAAHKAPVEPTPGTIADAAHAHPDPVRAGH